MAKQLVKKEPKRNEINENLPILDFILKAITFFRRWSKKVQDGKFNNLQFTIECYRYFSNNVKEIEELSIYLNDINLLDSYNSFFEVCKYNQEWLTDVVLDTNSELSKAQQFLNLFEMIKNTRKGLYELHEFYNAVAHGLMKNAK